MQRKIPSHLLGRQPQAVSAFYPTYEREPSVKEDSTGFTVPASGSIRKRHVCRLLRLFSAWEIGLFARLPLAPTHCSGRPKVITGIDPGQSPHSFGCATGRAG